MSIEPKKPGDEIIEIPAVPDAELQCIHCVGQVLELFFPGADAQSDSARKSVLNFLNGRWGDSPFTRFSAPPHVSSIVPENFAEQMKEIYKVIKDTQLSADRDEIIPPDPDEEEKGPPKPPKKPKG